MANASGAVILIHALFGALLWTLFRFLDPPVLGQALAVATALYVLGLAAWAWLGSHSELLEAWTFLLPLSVCLVLPDWMLVNQLHVLVFPDLGAPRYQGVPSFMAGLWVAPLLLVLWLSALAQRRAEMLSLLVAPVAALLIFGLAEWLAVRLNVWRARGVPTTLGVAHYVLPAEAALGLATWVVYSMVHGRGWLARFAGAAVVAALYAGALWGCLYASRHLTD